ncbi:unknown [Hungatella hathewayi CAG:224]|nr:unknown [Hungatella hathewayi CAG:224]
MIRTSLWKQSTTCHRRIEKKLLQIIIGQCCILIVLRFMKAMIVSGIAMRKILYFKVRGELLSVRLFQ